MTWLAAALAVVSIVACLRWASAPRLLAPLLRLQAIAPLVVAVAAIAATWSAWGSIDPQPTVGDESAYLLQARLLAHGRIAGDAPPIPEFFEQAHVLVTPVLAPKYPIGFGLAIVPGVMLGMAALVPLLLTGLSGALLWILARRVGGSGVALLACAIWLAAPAARYRAGFFSETTTTPLILLGWYALLHWREGQRQRWLAGVSLCLAGIAITRPFTAVAFALPFALAILPEVARRGAWRQLALAIAAGLPLLVILPLQNVATGGRWWQLPYDRYTRTYLPFDHIGFGIDDRAPLRARPPDLERLAQALKAAHRDFTVARLPANLVVRTQVFLSDLAGPGALLALLLLATGAIVAPRELRFAGGSALLLLAAHLLYAHAPGWSIYYTEVLPVAAVLAAVGFAWLSRRAVMRLGSDQAPERSALLMVFAAAIAAWPLPERLTTLRIRLEVAREPVMAFHEAIRNISTPAIVFVRYGEGQRLHRALVENAADFSAAAVWTARDLGDDNARLMAMAPERNAYIYDESRQTLERIGSARTSSTSGGTLR